MRTESPICDYDYFTIRSELIPGTLIKIGPLPCVDDFVRHMARVISGEKSEITLVNPQPRSFHNLAIWEIIEESRFKLKKKFIGRLGESTALVLPPDVSWASKLVLKRVDPKQPKVANFLVGTEMFTSAQQESIGNVVNEILLCGNRESATQFFVKIRMASKLHTFAGVEAHIKASTPAYAVELREGLEYIFC